jgi:hypothetical protein
MVTESFNQNKDADFMYTLYYSIGTYVKENALNEPQLEHQESCPVGIFHFEHIL